MLQNIQPIPMEACQKLGGGLFSYYAFAVLLAPQVAIMAYSN